MSKKPVTVPYQPGRVPGPVRGTAEQAPAARATARVPALPAELTAVRHGQSTANAAFAEAERTGALSVPITDRDADLPLTALGRAQAAATGRRLAAHPPQLVYCSPFRRTRETLDAILHGLAGADPDAPVPSVRFDERLRDRDTGAWEMQTFAALRATYPEEMARRDRVGPFYFRPPGGESFPDVALRVRSLLRDALPAAADRRLLIVAHDAIVLMLRLVLEHLDERQIADDVDAGGVIGNCTVTRWVRDESGLVLADFNDAAHLRAEDLEKPGTSGAAHADSAGPWALTC